MKNSITSHINIASHLSHCVLYTNMCRPLPAFLITPFCILSFGCLGCIFLCLLTMSIYIYIYDIYIYMSLIGEAEYVARRKQLANVAFRKLSTVWFRRAHISLQLRLRLYASFVIPVLTYNMGTWGLTQADLVRIDTYHRRHLRQIIGVRWPNRISNVALYHHCQSRPISESIITARWRLFGHVLRLPRDAPAQRAIDHYFADTEAATFRGRPRTSLPSNLCSDLRRIGRTLHQPADIEALRALSREQWRQMEQDTSA